jgi:hypothetical protein
VSYDETEDFDPEAQAFHEAWSAQVDREMELADDPAWVEVPA